MKVRAGAASEVKVLTFGGPGPRRGEPVLR
jgi:hypothetical protein